MYFIYDCFNNVVGNPNGYPTFKGANRQANMRTSKAFKAIWDSFHIQNEALDAAGEPQYDRRIYSIKLKEKG